MCGRRTSDLAIQVFSEFMFGNGSTVAFMCELFPLGFDEIKLLCLLSSAQMFSSELLGPTHHLPAVWWREERCTAAPGESPPAASNWSLTAQVQESPADILEVDAALAS